MIYNFVPAALRAKARKSPRLLSQCRRALHCITFSEESRVTTIAGSDHFIPTLWRPTHIEPRTVYTVKIIPNFENLAVQYISNFSGSNYTSQVDFLDTRRSGIFLLTIQDIFLTVYHCTCM